MKIYGEQKYKIKVSGDGYWDSLVSAFTSNTAKEIDTSAAKTIGTKVLTDAGNKASEKLMNTIFKPQPNQSSTKREELINRYRTLVSHDAIGIDRR